MEIPLDVCLCGQQKKLLKSYQSSGWQMLDLKVPHASDCTVESSPAFNLFFLSMLLRGVQQMVTPHICLLVQDLFTQHVKPTVKCM